MSFKWPIVLWALLLVPAALSAYVIAQQRRRAYAARFATLAMLPNVAPVLPGWRRHVPTALYLVALVALLLGLARPQAALSVPRERATVMIVLDTSRSMLARDVTPNRLQAAREAVDLFLDQLPAQFQVGLVGFARSARVLNRPTVDVVALRRALDSVETSVGTAIGDGIAQALQTRFDGDPEARRAPTVLLLLSDGNNTTGRVDPADVSDQAARWGIKIHTVGLGEPDADERRERGPRPPNFALLEQIAETTGARFFSAPTRERLDEVYRELGSEIAMVREYREITAGFVAGGLVLLALGSMLSAFWFNRFP